MAHFRGKQANVEQWLSLLEQNVPRWPDLSLTERNECTKGVRLLSDPSHFSCFGFKSAEVRARFDRILAAHASVLAAARAESVKSKKWWQFWIN